MAAAAPPPSSPPGRRERPRADSGRAGSGTPGGGCRVSVTRLSRGGRRKASQGCAPSQQQLWVRGSQTMSPPWPSVAIDCLGCISVPVPHHVASNGVAFSHLLPPWNTSVFLTISGELIRNDAWPSQSDWTGELRTTQSMHCNPDLGITEAGVLARVFRVINHPRQGGRHPHHPTRLPPGTPSQATPVGRGVPRNTASTQSHTVVACRLGSRLPPPRPPFSPTVAGRLANGDRRRDRRPMTSGRRVGRGGAPTRGRPPPSRGAHSCGPPVHQPGALSPLGRTYG